MPATFAFAMLTLWRFMVRLLLFCSFFRLVATHLSRKASKYRMHKNGTTWKSILFTSLRSVVCGGQTSVSSYAVPVSTRSNDVGDPPSMSSNFIRSVFRSRWSRCQGLVLLWRYAILGRSSYVCCLRNRTGSKSCLGREERRQPRHTKRVISL